MYYYYIFFFVLTWWLAAVPVNGEETVNNRATNETLRLGQKPTARFFVDNGTAKAHPARPHDRPVVMPRSSTD